MISILRTIEELNHFRQKISGTVGFVPTMGALHEGHASLLRQARKQSDHVILSIFVNPTQFNDSKDLENYPRTLETDQILAEREGVDALFIPQYNDLYPDHYLYEVIEKKWSHLFCGAYREGHFNGVLTIVLKLLNLVQPHSAFFGEKDYQQLRLIQEMVKAFFLKVQIVPVETCREADGLAMSSRNVRLTPKDRQRAPLFHQCLKSAPSAQAARQKLEEHGFRVEYIEDWENRRLGALYLGAVRLIDNVKIEH